MRATAPTGPQQWLPYPSTPSNDTVAVPQGDRSSVVIFISAGEELLGSPATPMITITMAHEEKSFLPQRIPKFISGSQTHQVLAWLSINMANTVASVTARVISPVKQGNWGPEAQSRLTSHPSFRPRLYP